MRISSNYSLRVCYGCLSKYAAFQVCSYIGVSKLSCKACHYWIEAYNSAMSTKFRTKGSHNKWYGRWARPGLGESANQSKVDAVFLASVEAEFCRHQLGMRMARTSGASDSSGSKEPMVSTNQLPVDEEGIEEWLKFRQILEARAWPTIPEQS